MKYAKRTGVPKRHYHFIQNGAASPPSSIGPAPSGLAETSPYLSDFGYTQPDFNYTDENPTIVNPMNGSSANLALGQNGYAPLGSSTTANQSNQNLWGPMGFPAGDPALIAKGTDCSQGGGPGRRATCSAAQTQSYVMYGVVFAAIVGAAYLLIKAYRRF